MTDNVVVVVVDALRADRVGAVGGRDLTPNIDRFAEDAAVFMNAFTTINTTDPAVTSIQTGRYPLSHGVLNHGVEVTDSEKQAIEAVPQLPECFSEAGYRTAKLGRPLGRWHRKGFDIYPESMETSEAFDVHDDSGLNARSIKGRISSGLEAIHPGFETMVKKAYRGTYHPVKRYLTGGEQNTHSSESESDEVLDMFSDFVDTEDRFYSFIHLMNTHGPYVADPERVLWCLDNFDYPVKRGHNSMPGPNHIGDIISSRFQEGVLDGEYPEIREKFYFESGEPTTAIVDAHYDAAVAEADERFGNIVDTLKQRGIYDDSLIVFLADHGECLAEHGMHYNHHGLYDVCTHIPLIVRPPGGADRTVDEFVQTTDVAPTIQSYADIEGLEPDGISLKPVIEDGEAIEREFVLAEEAHHQRRRMIRTHDSKLIHLVDGDTICRRCKIQHAPPVELYDLCTDSGEETNIAEQNPEKVEELRSKATDAVKELSGRCPQPGNEHIEYEDEEEVSDRLKALGYV